MSRTLFRWWEAEKGWWNLTWVQPPRWGSELCSHRTHFFFDSEKLELCFCFRGWGKGGVPRGGWWGPCGPPFLACTCFSLSSLGLCLLPGLSSLLVHGVEKEVEVCGSSVITTLSDLYIMLKYNDLYIMLGIVARFFSPALPCLFQDRDSQLWHHCHVWLGGYVVEAVMYSVGILVEPWSLLTGCQ